MRKAGGDGAESPGVQAAGGQEDEVTPTMAEGETKLSRNKRRKLKKKRRKEKFLSLGLTPSAAALQFIYQPEEGSREGEELIEDTQSNEKQMAELLEFLQATLEVYGREYSCRDAWLWSLCDGTFIKLWLNPEVSGYCCFSVVSTRTKGHRQGSSNEPQRQESKIKSDIKL